MLWKLSHQTSLIFQDIFLNFCGSSGKTDDRHFSQLFNYILGFYIGLKSWPHSEIQWASSMATKEIVTFLRKLTFSSCVNDSGATYNSLVSPEEMSFNLGNLLCVMNLKHIIPLLKINSWWHQLGFQSNQWRNNNCCAFESKLADNSDLPPPVGILHVLCLFSKLWMTCSCNP
jgi:hypothetical protein